jgi:hypothetical protein
MRQTSGRWRGKGMAHFGKDIPKSEMLLVRLKRLFCQRARISLFLLCVLQLSAAHGLNLVLSGK